MIDICDENIIAMYHFTDDGRVMGSIDGAKKLTQTVKNSKVTTRDDKEIDRIHVSILSSGDTQVSEDSYAYELAELSGGIVYSGASQVKPTPMAMMTTLENNDVKTETTEETNSNLIKILGQGNEGKYTVITSTGLIDSVKLKTVLNDSNKTDTDLDGLIDWNEVNVDIINNHLKNEGKQELKTVRNSDLPLFSDLILHSSEWGSFKPYLWTESDFARYAYYNCFDNVRILPIKSDPSKADSDGDGIVDCMKYFDSDAYQHNVNKEKYKITEFNDPNPLKFEYLWEWPTIDKSSSTKINQLSSGFIDDRNPPHGAIDITKGVKDTIVAAYDGIVIDTYSKYADKGNKLSGCGNYIFIQHTIQGKEYFSRYLHLDSVLDGIKPGTKVRAGQEIAIMGGTGGYPVHLDFQIGELDSVTYNKNGNLVINSGRIIDPVLFNKIYAHSSINNIPNINLNMLLNIPITIKNICSGGLGGRSCDDCMKFFDCKQYKKIDSDYECNDNCIKCKYHLRSED